MKFSESWGMSGTKASLTERLLQSYRGEIGQLRAINHYLFEQTQINRNKIVNNLLDEIGHIPHFPSYVDRGFIANATDSLTTRIAEDDDYLARIDLQISANDEKVKFQVEDNGIGLSWWVSEFMFRKSFWSKKRRSKFSEAYIGGYGIHMRNSKKDVKRLGGEIGFVNKGINQGAIFWYKLPWRNPE